MRKRNDTSKAQTPSSAGLRSSTRNSAAARRGEERSISASKEQNKSPSTVSKAAEEKASAITSGTASLKRSNSKKETPVAIEAVKVPLTNDPALPETSQPEREIDLTETCKEGMEKQIPETLMAESVEAISGTETLPTLALPEKLEAVDDGPGPESLKLEMETLTAGLTQAVEENTQPIDSGITSKDPTEAGDLSGQEQEKAAKVLAAGELSGQDQDSAAEAPTSDKKVGDLSGHDLDRAAKTPAVGTEAGESSGPDQERSAKAPALSTEAGEMSGQEEERAAKAPASGKEESLSVAGGEITPPPKELSVSPSQTQVMDEAEQSEPPSAIHALPSNPEEHAPRSLGSDDSACAPANTQQAQVASNPESNVESISPAATVEMNGSHQQEAAAISDVIPNTSLGKDYEILNPLVVVEADKATDKGPDSVKETPSFFHAENSFRNNMVSSVEGETVLIVENLSLTSQVPTKLDENLSGAMGGEVNELQKEADKKVHTGNTLGVGKDLVGLTFKKKFGRKFFEGKVVEYEPELNWYKVMYEDGDEEELDLKEVQRLLRSDEIEDDEQPPKRKHRRISSIPNSLKRSAAKAKRSGSPGLASSEDNMEDDTQVQERVKLRGYKKRLVIDTSNDGNADSLDSDNQLSTTSDEASDDDDDDDDDDDETAARKRNSTRKLKNNNRGKKRKRADDKSEEEFTALQSRLSTKLKEESLVKSQETPTEHRIATRRSSHRTSSDDYSSASLKKPQGDFQDKLRPESPASEVSPLGGGAKLIGRKTKKDFGGQFYIGEIVHYDNRVKYYKVRYEDGDEEELEWGELAPTLIPQEGNHHLLALEAPHEATSKHSQGRLKEHSRKGSTTKSKEGAIILYDGGATNGDLASSKRKWRKKVRTASVSVMMKGMDNWNAASTSAATPSEPPPRPLAAVRFASASDADVFEYYAWGEAVNFDRSKCPELRATRLLPTSSPVVHLAASRHHLVALTAAGQVWVWRCKHGSVRTRCNEWEHVALLDNRNVILVDISGPDVDRASAGYQPAQEDQVPDPFYLAAVCSNGEDIILQGSQPHESVHTYQYDNEPQHPGLRDAVMQSNSGWIDNVGNIVQVSVGMVEAADESPFVGYITDTDCVFIRSATRDYMEEVNLVTGYTGKPVKIQCGRVYHAIIMTDDGRAWTWGQGYYPGSNLLSAGFASKSTSPFSVCQPAVGTLVGRKVVDVGCYGEDFIALSNDGDVHQWTHALPNPAAGVYNVPATPVYGQGPSIASGDKLKQVAIGAGICAGISESSKVHTWRTSLKGGFVGTVGVEREALTPLGRDEGYTETAILSLGTRGATKIMCVAGSLLVVVKRKYRGRRGGRRKVDPSMKGKVPEDEAAADG